MSRSCLAEEDTIASYVEELLRKQVPYEARRGAPLRASSDV